jgi:hypothetical protein
MRKGIRSTSYLAICTNESKIPEDLKPAHKWQGRSMTSPGKIPKAARNSEMKEIRN